MTVMIPGEMTAFSAHEDATVPHPKLNHIDVELTRECNLECVHCSSGLETEGSELSLSATKRILKEAKSLGLETVGLTGGEPFLRSKKLFKLVDFCRNEIGARVHIHSNGSRIFGEEARWAKQSEVDITISFFGSDPRTHDAITKRTGSMKSALRGLRNLVNAKANLTVFVVPMRPNSSEIPSLIELISEEGVENVRILLPSPTGRALHRFAELELTDEQVLWLRKELVRVQTERGIRLMAGFCTRLAFPDLEVLKGHDRCYAADNRVHVDAFGNVYPCTASSGRMVFSAGNVQMSTCTLTEIWRFSPFFQLLRRFHSYATKKCQSCARFGNCMSGCRVRMSYKYGDATIADPQCGGPY
jgi:radical SAM protein with 4Fe4S-binding SPASM domain